MASSLPSSKGNIYKAVASGNHYGTVDLFKRGYNDRLPQQVLLDNWVEVEAPKVDSRIAYALYRKGMVPKLSDVKEAPAQIVEIAENTQEIVKEDIAVFLARNPVKEDFTIPEDEFPMADAVVRRQTWYDAPKIEKDELIKMVDQLNTPVREIDAGFRRENFTSHLNFRQGAIAQPKANGQPYKVLFVNDDKWVIMGTQTDVKGEPFEYDVAISVSFALNLLKNNPGKYDFVLADVHFKHGGNGFDISEFVMNMPAEKRPVVIAMSAESDDDNVVEKLYKKGFTGAYARGRELNKYLSWLIGKGYKGAGYGGIIEEDLDFSDSQQLIEDVFDPKYGDTNENFKYR